jgi:putative hydrolase of the HAD superfamily
MHFGVDDKELSLYFEENFLDNIVSHNELVEGAEDVLEYLKAKNYTLHIISNGFQEVTERNVPYPELHLILKPLPVQMQ